MALVEQIPLTKACDSQRNREALYSPFVPLPYMKSNKYSAQFLERYDVILYLGNEGWESMESHLH